ncbi:hypothetical protein PGTUg99_012620 [Puccinia graminis f. sp. tritici]|uniref:Uncharacterized protein n=1 Tax=Puccinia graminis f. sp. tritici TaxID=56615 RepID=A0A5B0QLM8_PUCGR|nr:hypothetical protein PGTUg99_012620 [Puccinia graminis f. sp. tritici]
MAVRMQGSWKILLESSIFVNMYHDPPDRASGWPVQSPTIVIIDKSLWKAASGFRGRTSPPRHRKAGQSASTWTGLICRLDGATDPSDLPPDHQTWPGNWELNACFSDG